MEVKDNQKGREAECVLEIIAYPPGICFLGCSVQILIMHPFLGHTRMGDEVELEIFDPDLLSGSEDEEDVHQEEALLGVDEVSGNFNSASNKVPNLGIIPKRSQWDQSADMVPIPILPPSLNFSFYRRTLH